MFNKIIKWVITVNIVCILEAKEHIDFNRFFTEIDAYNEVKQNNNDPEIKSKRERRAYYDSLLEQAAQKDDEANFDKEKKNNVSKGLNSYAGEEDIEEDISEEEIEQAIQKRNNARKEYYYQELDKSLKISGKNVVVYSSLYGSLAFKAFDDCGNSECLSNLIFQRNCFTIGDIFLLSRLSDQNKMRIDNVNARVPERPPGSPEAFGSYESDQYIALLAPTQVNICAEFRELLATFGATYRFYFTESKKIAGFVGGNFEIRSQLHIMDLSFCGGKLFNFGFVPVGINQETPLTAFYTDFIDICDFFKRAVLQPKCLRFKERQRKIGVGNINLYGLVDAAGYFNYVNGLQFGFNVIIPTGSKLDPDIVWDVQLGNASTEIDFYTQVLFGNFSNIFNPSIRVAGGLTTSYRACLRIPKLKTQSIRDEIGKNKEIIVPIETFEKYFVDPFAEFDTCIPFFADQVVAADVKPGNNFLVSAGNYFFYNALRLGIFYDFSLKGEDRITVKKSLGCCDTCDFDNCGCICDDDCTIFDTCLLECATKSHFHRIGWNLTYKLKDLLEFNIGSQHIIAGRNVARLHQIYGSLIILF